MKKVGELKGMPIVEGSDNKIKKGLLQYKKSDNGFTLLKRDDTGSLTSAVGNPSGPSNAPGRPVGSSVDLEPKDNTITFGYPTLLVTLHKSNIDNIVDYGINFKMFINGSLVTLEDFTVEGKSCCSTGYYTYNTYKREASISFVFDTAIDIHNFLSLVMDYLPQVYNTYIVWPKNIDGNNPSLTRGGGTAEYSFNRKAILLIYPDTITNVGSSLLYRHAPNDLHETVIINSLVPPHNTGIDSDILNIVVPDEAVEAYKAADGFNAVADKIIGKSQFTIN